MSPASSVPSNGPSIYIPAIVFSVISPIIVAVRIWSRINLQTKLGADDYMILAALVRRGSLREVINQVANAFQFFALCLNATLIVGEFISLLPTSSLASLLIGVIACHYGYGKHGADLTVYNKRHALMVVSSTEIPHNLPNSCSSLPFANLLIRAQSTLPRHRSYFYISGSLFNGRSELSAGSYLRLLDYSAWQPC